MYLKVFNLQTNLFIIEILLKKRDLNNRTQQIKNDHPFPNHRLE
jgi:hypothetical protein